MADRLLDPGNSSRSLTGESPAALGRNERAFPGTLSKRRGRNGDSFFFEDFRKLRKDAASCRRFAGS
jgi:hypothetical protein